VALVIALLGAECTGKTQLSVELAQHLRARGLTCETVPEALRQWCDQHRRTPQAHEQLGIAHAQTQAIRAAQSKAQVVIADTTALQTAVYSELYFGDASLYGFAAQQQGLYGATCLMGLDIAWQAGDWQRDGPAQRERTDAALRLALLRSRIGFTSVYGHGMARLEATLQGIQSAIFSIANTLENTPAIGQFGQKTRSEGSFKPWVWVCDKCSDPECEHQLFARLQASASNALTD
jgi:nicotinamide riboside kinase